jgi:hypothetical protein
MIWVDTDGTTPVNVVTRWTVTPAAGTTSLSGNDSSSLPLVYTPGLEMLFLNGVLLARTTDYTATSGVSITLASATVAGDIVIVLCPLQITTSDTYTQTQISGLISGNNILTIIGALI